MEPIELSFVSAGASIPGLDDVLSKLERVDALTAVLGRRSVVIDLRVNGAGQLQTTMDSVQRLTELLRAAGDVRGAGLVGAGQLDMSEIANRTQRMIAAKQAELLGVENAITEHHRRIQQLQTRFQFGSAAYNQEELKSRAAISQGSGQRTEIATQLALMQQALGVADSLRGVKIGEGIAQGVQAATAAEAKLGTQALDTTAAMSAQMEVAKMKAGMMRDLAAATMKTAEADRTQAAAARENAQANAQAGGAHTSAATGGLGGTNLLGTRRRYERDENGNLVLAGSQNRFATGLGREVTVDMGGNETRTTDSIRAQRAQMAQILSEYRQRRAQVSDPAQRALLDEQVAGEIRNLHAGMGPLGTTTEWGLGLPGKAGAKEESARKIREQLAGKNDVAAQREANELLKIRRSMAAADERAAAEAAAQAETAAQASALKLGNKVLHSEFHGLGASGERWRFGDPFETFESGGGRERRSKAQKSTWDGRHETVTHVERWDAAGNQLASTLEKTNNALTHTGRGVTAVGETFARNLYSVTTWTAAVGTLYALLGAMKGGFAGAIHVDREMALLTGVLSGSHVNARTLTGGVLGLSGRQGRTIEEGMEAATKFAHLPHARGEILPFTELAMMMANISGLPGGESGHAVASVSEAFGFDAARSRVAMNSLNALANRSNTTVGELLETMGRTGAIAKNTGFGFTEYAGLLSGGAGATGRPVSEFAQSFGMMLTNLNDPDKAREMKQRYGIDLFGQGGAAKPGPELVRDIQKRYSEMSPDAGLGMLSFMSGGRRNAQRLAAIFDNYDDSIVKSVEAQRDLNSATEANNRILDTTQAKLNAVATAWKGVWHNAYQQGGLKSATNAGLSLVSGVIGAADFGLGAGLAGLKDVGDMALGRWGGESHLGEFWKGSKLAAKAQYAQDRLMKGERSIVGGADMSWEGRTQYAQKEGLASAEGDALGAFTGMSNRLMSGSTGPEEARKLIGNLVALSGGGDDQRRQWQAAYAARGRGAMPGLTGPKFEEMKQRAEKARETRDISFNSVDANFGDVLRGLQTEMDRDGGTERKAQLALLIRDITKQREEFKGGENRRAALNDLDTAPPDSLGAATMRERVRYTLAGADWFTQASGFSSPYERDKMRWQREELGWRGSFAGSLEEKARRLEGTVPREALAYSDQARSIRAADDQTRLMLDWRQPFAAARDTQFDAGLDVRRRLSGFGAGLTPTRQMADFLGGAGGEMDRIAALPDEMARRGAGEAMLNELIGKRNDLLGREFALTREINQTRQEMQREASRTLLLAGAGDQLAAAGLQNFLQSRGGRPMGEAEFGALDPETKRQMLSFTPELAPGVTNRLGELTREKADLAANGPGMLKDLSDKIEALRGGAPAVLNFNPTVNFAFGDQFNAAIQGMREIVEGKLEEAIGQMRQDNARFREQRMDVGADAMVGAQQ